MSHLNKLNSINPEAVADAEDTGPNQAQLGIIANMFQALSDQTRVKILYALMRGPLCVRDLAIVVQASESSVSHHLRVLKDRYLVSAQREGNIINYFIAGHHLAALFQEAEYHSSHIHLNIPDHPYPSQEVETIDGIKRTPNEFRTITD